MSFETNGPGGKLASLEAPLSAPYDAIERGTFLFADKINNYYLDNVPEIMFTPGIENEIKIPVTSNGYPMSPIEKSTGTPLPIITSKDTSPGSSKNNEHHAYFFSEWYNSDPSTAALRLSRIQSVDRDDHIRYHQRFIGTLPTPNEQKTFAEVIRNCAGYVPSYGVCVSKNSTVIRPLRNHEKQALRAPGTFYPEYHDAQNTNDAIGKFLLGYALRSDLGVVNAEDVREFLSLSRGKESKEQKFELGMKIARSLFDSAVTPLRAEFEVHKIANSLMENPLNSCPVNVAEAQVRHFKRSIIKNLHLSLQERTAV